MDIPNLAGVATADLVEKIGTGKFTASYINWSRTMHLLREHAPGWLPDLVRNPQGDILHQAPVGAYLLICFRNDGASTPAVPQAVMNSRNEAIPLDKITARDITDTHRRGVCMAAAMTFGLAYELWAKMPLESGHGEDDDGNAGSSHKETPQTTPAKGPVKQVMSREIKAGWIEYIIHGDGDAAARLADAIQAAKEVGDEDAAAAFQRAAK